MKKTYISWLAFGLSAALVVACGSSKRRRRSEAAAIPVPDLGLIPMPRDITGGNGQLPARRPTPTWCIRAARAPRPRRSTSSSSSTQQKLVALSKRRGRHAAAPATSPSCWPAGRRKDLGAEGYSLAVTPDRHHHHRAHARGPLLWRGHAVADHHREAAAGRVDQRARASRSSTRRVSRGAVSCSIPRATIQSPEYIKQFIDWMALHKLNVLHWHLTDDQAWRLEIKKYPKLTSVGAWRVPAGAAARADIDPATGKPRLYGGFYTQDQVRDIVAHAASAPRHRRSRDRDAGTCDRRGGRLSASSASLTNRRRPCPRTGASSRRCSTSRSPRSRSSRTCSPKSSSCFRAQYIHVGGDEAHER